MTNDELIAKIEAYAGSREIAAATVTSRAVGNSRLYARLKAGGGCTLTVAQRILDFIARSSDLPPTGGVS